MPACAIGDSAVVAKRIADDGPMVVIGRLDSLLLFMPLLVAALAWAGLLVARRRR